VLALGAFNSDPGTFLAGTLNCRVLLSSFDHRHRFVVNAIVALPFGEAGPQWQKAALGGWQAGGIFSVQSGAPFTVNLPAGTEPANIGTVGGNNLERPNLIGDPNAGPRTAAQWFNTAAFAVPQPYTFGNAPRNAVFGPGFAGLDLSLQKTFSLNEGVNLQFRAESYNALNHANFDIPGRIYGSSTFGEISSAESPRQLQFALKLLF